MKHDSLINRVSKQITKAESTENDGSKGSDHLPFMSIKSREQDTAVALARFLFSDSAKTTAAVIDDDQHLIELHSHPLIKEYFGAKSWIVPVNILQQMVLLYEQSDFDDPKAYIKSMLARLSNDHRENLLRVG